MSSTEPLEASIKIRDGKKWKKRFCVLQSLASGRTSSDVALLSTYKNVKFSRKPGPKRRVCRIEGFYGLESGFLLDKESRTLAIISQASIIALAFDSDPTLRNWELWFRSFFGHGCQYSVYVIETPATLSVIRNTNARLHLRDGRFCLVVDSPPRIALELSFREIRRCGAFENKFCVEAGSRTGSLAGVYMFRTGHRDQMSFTFRLAAQGGLHSYLSSNSSNNERIDSSQPNVVYGSVESATNQIPVDRRLHAVGDGFGSSEVGCSMIDRRPLPCSASAKGVAVTLLTGDSYGVRYDQEDGLGHLGTVINVATSPAVLGREQSYAVPQTLNDGEELPRLARRSESEKHVRSSLRAGAPGSFSQVDITKLKTNYVNQNYLESLDCYYNADRKVSVPADGSKDYPSAADIRNQMEAKGESGRAMPSYAAMVPRGSVYERMESSSGEERVKDLRLQQPDDDTSSVSSGIFMKPFEPLILRKEQSGMLAWVSAAPCCTSGRKFSLPATLMAERPSASLRYTRRFSWEEERRARSESPVSAVDGGGGLAAIFRSTGGLARNALRSGSMKAKAFLDSIVHRTSLRKSSTSSKFDGGTTDAGGCHSRACSEPPTTLAMEDEHRRSPATAEEERMKASRSSLDLDEVVYDIASTTSAQHLPVSVLKRIGLKPLVPDAASSSVKLPVCPKHSYGTDSTRSSDSTNGGAANDQQFDGAPDSVSVGSDNSDSDSVFASRAVRKRQVARSAADNMKTTGKAKPGKNNALTPLSTSTPMATLEPHRLSINAQRRLRQDVTKPLSGSYSRYDGDGSCESPLMSPSVLLPLAGGSRAAGSGNRSMILNRPSQGYAKFEIGGSRSKNEKRRAAASQFLSANVPISPPPSVTAHSPSPPAEPAPPPPADEGSPVGRSVLPTLPLSALPRLEGHVFKFPPLVSLNYAKLAAQNEIVSSTPNSEGRSSQIPTSELSAGTEASATSVEYAKIDQVATQAARKVLTSRREDARVRWSSSHALSGPSESAPRQENSEQSTVSKCRRPFSLKRSLIRRRPSTASLAGL